MLLIPFFILGFVNYAHIVFYCLSFRLDKNELLFRFQTTPITESPTSIAHLAMKYHKLLAPSLFPFKGASE